MKYLITGANGFVGHALCNALAQLRHEVVAAVRGIDLVETSVPIKRVSVGDINEQTDWSAALLGVNVVIHLAARVHVMHDTADDPLEAFRRVNTFGTDKLARAAVASGVKRLVYVSSIKVNGEETSGSRVYSEQDFPAPQDPYSISKWEAEHALQRVAQETGLEVVIVRPPLVYGAGVKGNFAQMLRVIALGIPLPLGSVNNKRDLIYVGNLVDALITCSSHSAAAGQVYLLNDGSPVSTPELIQRLAEALCIPSRIFPFPPVLLEYAGKLIGKSAQVERLLGSLRIDSGKIHNQLNWTPPYTMLQGLLATAEWYRKQQ